MNNGLTPASQRSPFHATTISLLGMLLCLFTTLAVLAVVSRDQSGAALAEVTSSFGGSLRDHGRNDVAVIAAAFRQAAAASEDEHTDKNRSGMNATRNSERKDRSLAVAEEHETGLSAGEKLSPTDVNGPVFSHLMTELQRYCTVSRSEELGGQLFLDLHSQIPQSEGFIRVALEKIVKTCRKTNDSVHQLPAEFEVIIWASTPTTEAMAASSEEALTHELSLEKSLKAQTDSAIKISSSGRIWTRPHSPRPLATVVVRAAKRSMLRN